MLRDMLRNLNDIFDDERYLATYPLVRQVLETGEFASAEDHYYTVGAHQGFEPCWRVWGVDRVYSCDVLLQGDDGSPVDQYWAVLGQAQVRPHFYLWDATEHYLSLHGMGNVTVIAESGRSQVQTLQDLISRWHAPYIITHVPWFMPARFLWSQLNRLENNGRELLVRSSIEYGDLAIVRRATVFDMGGFQDVPYYWEEFRARLVAEDRPVDRGGYVRSALEDAPREQAGSLRHYALGCVVPGRVRVDVVMPFHGNLEYVDQAVISIIEQEQADVTLHLVDDASPGDGESRLRRWSGQAQVRLYRNRQNIGQFLTVNNLVPYFETNYLAIMDADDVAVPHRLTAQINLMRATGAALGGTRMRLFGAEQEWAPAGRNGRVWVRRGRRYWNASYPHEIGRHYLPHTSIVMTKQSFLELNGYTDFGHVDKNKTANDTDLLYRYYFGGYDIVYTVDSLVLVRRHAQSCTQNEMTGWATTARGWAAREVERRRTAIYRHRQGSLESFGALSSMGGRNQRVTEPWNG